MRITRYASLFIVLIVAVVAIACSQQSPTGNTATPPTSGGSNVAPSGNTVEINVTAESFQFFPSTISVHQGDHVIIHVVDSDRSHGLAIEGYGKHVEFGPGGDGATLDFIADKAGTFRFFCDVPCGPGHRGMTGTLIVAA